jgi:23S rRNA (uridine2552-2'-O)-methyltransferase
MLFNKKVRLYKNMQKKNKINRAWVDQHLNDSYVKKSQHDGYRSRAAYKLLELATEYNLFKNVNVVLDLGSSPGSWSQVLVKSLNNNSKIIALDMLSMDNIQGVEFVHGDFTDNVILDLLLDKLNGDMVDLIISDIAPNLSGIKSVDQAKIAYVAELILDFVKDHLKIGGNLVIKIFHGSEFDNIVKQSRLLFDKVLIKKPNASRGKSSETYLLALGKK